MLRHLRYLPAVVFALLAMGFVALWLWSYGHYGFVAFPLGTSRHVRVSATDGDIIFETSRHESLRGYAREWISGSFVGSPATSVLSKPTPRFVVVLQSWFLALSSLALAALLAFKPITRFTVRGLLISTTLLAAVLGLAVYAI